MNNKDYVFYNKIHLTTCVFLVTIFFLWVYIGIDKPRAPPINFESLN